MSAKLFTWDWKEQPPLVDIAALVTEMSRRGEVHLTSADTQSDEYALVVSDRQLTGEQATYFYEHADEPVRVEVTIEPSWTHEVNTEVIEVYLGELIGYEGMERHERIIGLAEDHVNNVCSWGAQELGPDGKPAED